MIAPETALAHLGGLTSRFAELVATADLDAPVAPCPGWTIEDLVRHLGGVHRWVEGLILGSPATGTAPPTNDRAALAAWYAECAAALLSTLREHDPADQVTVFDDQTGPLAFWIRRQLHETAMHLDDLGEACGTPVGYDAELVLDGIDEVVSVLFPRQVRLGRIPPLESSLGLVPTGRLERWVLAGDGSPLGLVVPEAELHGPPEAILLLLWGRVPAAADEVHIAGDRQAGVAILGADLVP
jgi:uncharacterized protein (TIGR03083 family)